MGIRVIILSDNVAAAFGFLGEHGLSILVQTPGGSVLFDCGQSDIAVRNARTLGVDLKAVDCVALSHGHYDHTAGLLPVLFEAGRKKVFAHPGVFLPRFFVAGGVKRFIGIPYSETAVRSSSCELVLGEEQREILRGVYLTGEIERIDEYTFIEPNLYVEREGELQPDSFSDDQALVVKTEEGVILVTGCAHAGIANTVRHVQKRFGSIKAVVGGTHLGLTDQAHLQSAVRVLKEVEAEKFVLTHCTGIRLVGILARELGERYTPGHSGMVLEF